VNILCDGVALYYDGMEALGFFRHSGFGAVQADGRGGVRGRLGIGDFAGKDDPALDGFRKDSLTRFGVLIPAECFSRQEGIAKPLERDEGVTAAFCFGEGGAKLLHSNIEVGGHRCDIFRLIVIFAFDGSPGCATLASGNGAVVESLEIDADFVFFGRPRIGGGIATFAAAVFTAELDDGLISGRGEEPQCSRKARILGEGKLAKGLFNDFFSVGNGQIAYVYTALRSSIRLHEDSPYKASLACLFPPRSSGTRSIRREALLRRVTGSYSGCNGPNVVSRTFVR